MKYIIMAAGKGTRWDNYLGVPKHLIEICGETLLGRTTRLLKENGITDYIISCENPNYAQYGEIVNPPVNECEIDRFIDVFPEETLCYLYGDVYYSENAIKTIVETQANDILFFGHEWEIFAIKVINRDLFFQHKNKVRELYFSNVLDRCIGWEIYRSLNNIPFGQHIISDRYVKILDETDDIDYPHEYEEFKRKKERGIRYDRDN